MILEVEPHEGGKKWRNFTRSDAEALELMMEKTSKRQGDWLSLKSCCSEGIIHINKEIQGKIVFI